LVAAAVVGTERKPVPSTVVAEVAGLVGAEIAGGADELTLLATAGALAAYRRTGLTVEHGDPAAPPAPADPDPRPLASPAATQLLELLLEGHVRVAGGPVDLVREWLERCAASHHRPPAPLLPVLLHLGERNRDLRPVIVAAGGPRLTWLAAHNATWSWAIIPGSRGPAGGGFADAGDRGEVWRTGEAGVRMGWLREVRAVDPAWALGLVDETWGGETAKDRAEIVGVLRAGLGMGDEAFLEAALDDRAAGVRAAAAELLAGLPGSALAGRMTERLRPLVAVGGGRRRRTLEVGLPDDPDPAARRDGIVDQGAPAATGRRAWWLIQIVGATPLRFWAELGLTPGDTVHLAADQPELVLGLVRAAGQQRDGEWAGELLKVRSDPALLRVLPPEAAHAALGSVLGRCGDAAVAGLLAAVPRPWPPGPTQTVIARLVACRNAVAIEQALPHLAAAGDPATGAAVERWIDSLGPHDRLRHQLRGVAHALSIRQTIAQELA
jgi:hypothetical protein